MNIALIFAGGAGTRMHTKTKPKQFLELNGKPIIIHTMEYFEAHPEIDAMVVVCIGEWIGYLNDLLEKYRMKKVRSVIPGGKTGQESIYLGLCEIEQSVSKNPEKDIVLIHDGVRPLISEELISENIACVKKNGNAVTTAPVVETVIEVNDAGEMVSAVDRARCKHAKAPQSFYLADILAAHRRALDEGETEVVDSATMMAMYGHKLYTVDCSSENIKITTPADFYVFRAIVEARENSQIWGI